MKRMTKPWYPGKPGPKATGLERERQFPLMLATDERLYITLKAYDKGGLKPSPYIRKRALPKNWRDELPVLIKKYPEVANGKD